MCLEMTKISIVSCHYSASCSEFEMRWDEMGCFVISFCYLQWKPGPFRPRKIGSTFEMNIRIITHMLPHMHRLGLCHFFFVSNNDSLRVSKSAFVSLFLTWRSKLRPLDLFLRGWPRAAGKTHFFPDRGRIVSLALWFPCLGLYTIIF